MTNGQIKQLLILALQKANTDGPCYDVSKLVIQIELIISMLDQPSTKITRETSKDIGDIK